MIPESFASFVRACIAGSALLTGIAVLAVGLLMVWLCFVAGVSPLSGG